MRWRVDGGSGLILGFGGHEPMFRGEAWIMDGAVATGDLEMGEESSLWFHAVARSDTGSSIRIGRRVNIQDHAMCHTSGTSSVLTIGDEVTVGHRAILHGCELAPLVLVGMGAVVLDHTEIGEGCLVAAGSVVLERKKFAPFTLIAGAPAVAKRTLDAETVREAHRLSALHYLEKARAYGGRGRVVEAK